MAKTQIAFRANGLYEKIVALATQDLDVEVTELPQGQPVTYEQVKHLKMGWRDHTVTDMTVYRATGEVEYYGHLDSIVSRAYQESLGTVTAPDLMVKLMEMAVKNFPPSRVHLVRQSIDDHPIGQSRGKWDADTDGLSFYSKLIEQVTGLAPEITSASKVVAASTDWVLLDRHASGKVRVEGGIQLVVPAENLAQCIASFGLIGQEESDVWEKAAAQKLREYLTQT